MKERESCRELTRLESWIDEKVPWTSCWNFVVPFLHYFKSILLFSFETFLYYLSISQFLLHFLLVSFYFPPPLPLICFGRTIYRRKIVCLAPHSSFILNFHHLRTKFEDKALFSLLLSVHFPAHNCFFCKADKPCTLNELINGGPPKMPLKGEIRWWR